MKVYSAESGEVVYEQNGCTGVRLYAVDGVEYVHLSLEPGGAIPEHALPFPVSFCVLEGRGMASIAGEEVEVCCGEMVECASEVPRGWRNESKEPLRILVIKRIGG